jgi:hypothetical protein
LLGTVTALHKPRRHDVSENPKLPGDADLQRLGRLQPEVKVNMAIDMTDAMVQVCVDGMRTQNPSMTEQVCMKKLRERFEWAKRRRSIDRTVRPEMEKRRIIRNQTKTHANGHNNSLLPHQILQPSAHFAPLVLLSEHIWILIEGLETVARTQLKAHPKHQKNHQAGANHV